MEIEAHTVEEAVRSALRQLKMKKEEVTIEVLREEEKGLFGMPGSKSARIRATVRQQKKSVDKAGSNEIIK